MKRKRLDRNVWWDITEKRYIQKTVRTEEFEGHLSVLYIDGMTRPTVWALPEGTVTVCDVGMKWLQILPQAGDFLITAMINRENRIVHWYIDMADGWGYLEDGMAYYDDLYLDLEVQPCGWHKVDDMDELQEALDDGDISQAQFDRALDTLDRLTRGILPDVGRFEAWCMRLLAVAEKQE